MSAPTRSEEEAGEKNRKPQLTRADAFSSAARRSCCRRAAPLFPVKKSLRLSSAFTMSSRPRVANTFPPAAIFPTKRSRLPRPFIELQHPSLKQDSRCVAGSRCAVEGWLAAPKCAAAAWQLQDVVQQR